MLLASLNIVHAQGDLKLSNNAQEVLKFFNDPQNKNDTLNDPQNQNDVELIMFIMKAMEDKDIKEINQKINFVDTFLVSDYIKM